MTREEAIKIVKDLYDKSLFLKKDKEAVRTLIPEVEESEDERIRKALIKSFDEFLQQNDYKDEVCFKYVNVKDAITWLEKQGEQNYKIIKGKNYFCVKTHNYAGVEWIKGTKYYASDNYTLVNQGCECYCPEYSKEEHNNLFEEVKCDGCVEKQGEQKPATMSLDEAIEHCKEKSCDNSACALEHKQLEKWLTELKELKEQKPAWSEDDESWFKELELMALSFSNDDSYRKEFFNWFKSLKDRVQPQPKREWSEDDSVMIDNILGTYKTLEDMLDLTTCQDKDILESMNFERDWIKSLKYRIQPKQERSEEKEKDLFNTAKHLREYAERCVQGEYSKMEIFNLADRIESLRPQTRCGWNDMSVKPIYPCDILYQQPNGNMFIYRYIEGGRANDAQTPTFCNLDENGKWIYLKDVKPQNTWKPNDEQLKALKVVVGLANSTLQRTLESLYNDLKKLREE